MNTAMPYVLLSAAMSLDGYLDDASQQRLLLSSAQDMDQVRRLRAEFDAVVVGGRTVRKDNPSLLAIGGANPARIVITRSADLDPTANVFATRDSRTIVWCEPERVSDARSTLNGVAQVEPLTGFAQLPVALKSLSARGIRRVMVEGGGQILTQFLQRGLADELRLAIAPILVGDAAAPRFVGPGRFAHDKDHRALLRKVDQLGDTAVLYYRLSR